MGLKERFELAKGGERDELSGLLAEKAAGGLLEVLDDGFVRYIDSMGDDAAIVQAARVSYGSGTKSVLDDRSLIRYLMRHRHTTPFEMVEFKFHVRVPMDAWRQWIRHRTASVNEYSTRYSLAIDSQQTTTPDGWRRQSDTNRQGSGGTLTSWPEDWDVREDAELNLGEWESLGPCGIDVSPGMQPGEFLSRSERWFHQIADQLYKVRIRLGVAREQARKDLPLSTYTEAYWKIDLHNLFSFLSLRMAPDAQHEIRHYAVALGALIRERVPAAWEAFEDYRLKAVTFSGPEVEELKRYVRGADAPTESKVLSRRELGEFATKLRRLATPLADCA